ncbi:nucleotidyltransferase family protein [Arcobacter caeni]|uniref:MobA-like NTP transferase domain-containing protein n=1 Tax=Arcobacter caeni TaxID=1912877 RepID=A0A363D1X8_9BACT|nr:nucleotidyltransferase family protein [Arcobacter caeni]PUE65097.1 hypothetical protein B0174_04675 [Arcobacter caeni]
MEKSKNLAVIILAAGKSSRLEGKTKQLLKYQDESLIKIAVKKALKISSDVFVVLGHEKEQCMKELKDFNINIVINENYHQGMGTSISKAIKYTQDFENSMIMLCDQPFIPTSHYEELKSSLISEVIIASKYNNNSLVPAIFPKKYYEELLKLNEDKGAKSLLNKHSHITLELSSEMAIDIDTSEDVDLYLRKDSNSVI